VAGGAEVAGPAGEGEELFFPALGAVEAGEASGEITAPEKGATAATASGRNGPIVRRWRLS